MGNDVAVGIGGASGNFELNVFKPLIIHNVLQSLRLLGDACANFDRFCAPGIEPNRDRIAREPRPEPDARHRAQPAHRLRQRREDREEGAQGRHHPARKPRVALGLVTAEQFDAWVDPRKMTEPGE